MKRDLGDLGRVAVGINDIAVAALEEDGAAAVDLAVVEALTNAILHGQAESGALIDIEVADTADALVIEIFDTAPPMPLFLLEQAGAQKLDIDVSDLDSIPESGRGLSLIVLSMDHVSFHNEGPRTRMRMVRNKLR